jgi:hypothetical protein
MKKDWRPDVMGTADEVRGKISAHLIDVDWSDPTWGVYAGAGYSFEFNLGKEVQVDAFTVHVRGSGDALTGLLQFAKPNNWSLLDYSSGEFIDIHKPSDEGWRSFQRYRDQVIKTK